MVLVSLAKEGLEGPLSGWPPQQIGSAQIHLVACGADSPHVGIRQCFLQKLSED